MDISPLLTRLATVVEDGGTVVTVCLDVSKQAIPPDTRVFLRDQVLKPLTSGARSPEAQPTFEAIARRIAAWVDGSLPKEADWVFIAAGATLWETLTVAVPLGNLVHIGRMPYLAPLLEAQARYPRSYVVRADARQATIDEVELGEARNVSVVEVPSFEMDVQRATARPGRGGARIDRHRQWADEVVASSLRDAAKTVAAAHRERPGEIILFFGPRTHAAVFHEALPGAIAGFYRYGGGADRRSRDVMSRALREIAEVSRDRMEREQLEFHERRAQGHFVALGAREVMEQLNAGRVRRVFVRSGDPVPGLACSDCGTRYAGTKVRCDYCTGELRPVSLTQEMSAFSLKHPGFALNFVAPPAAWLDALGGLAAILTARPTAAERAS